MEEGCSAKTSLKKPQGRTMVVQHEGRPGAYCHSLEGKTKSSNKKIQKQSSGRSTQMMLAQAMKIEGLPHLERPQKG